jgi:hypothetical protein
MHDHHTQGDSVVANFTAGIGVDLSREGLQETPARMARAYAELLTAHEFKVTTFDNDEGYVELGMARDNSPASRSAEHCPGGGARISGDADDWWDAHPRGCPVTSRRRPGTR